VAANTPKKTSSKKKTTVPPPKRLTQNEVDELIAALNPVIDQIADCWRHISENMQVIVATLNAAFSEENNQQKED